MDPVAWRVYFALRSVFDREEGQDLVEYAMLVALFALGAIAGMNSVGEQVDGILQQMAALILRVTT
jgi:Flp pilus assembly pilin Flp